MHVPNLMLLIKLIIEQELPKGDFNWAATGRFFLREEAAVHTQATIKPCRRPLRDIESYVRVKNVPFWKTFVTKKMSTIFKLGL